MDASQPPGTGGTTAAPDCYHCREPIRGDAVGGRVGGALRMFCCSGCSAAAQWIDGAHLEDYYRFRQAPAGRVGTEVPDFAAFDRDAVLAGHSRVVDGGREITVLTDAMRCAACAWLIDHALRPVPGVIDVTANAVTGRIRIAWVPGTVKLSALMARLAALGYRPWLATGEAREQARRRERRRWLMRLGVAGLGAMQAMMLAEALYLDTSNQMPVATRDFFRWVTFLVSTPVVFYSGWPFLEGMWRELRGRRLGMDTLIGGSTLLAYFASLLETVRGGPHVWYDAAVMFVFLLLAARMLEQRARNVASAQVDALARARPALATRETLAPAGNAAAVVEQVPLDELAPGDVVRVAPGEAVPADGVLLDTASAFDEALLTGESAPVGRRPGDAVLAGSHCREQPARIRLTRTGGDTRLSQLARLVDRAQAGRPPLARATERIASVFVACLLVAAAAVYAWWHVHEPSRALEVTLAVLVVSCPCALSLAVPAALTTAHGTLARLGVLALRGEALATLARIDRIVFDKTGTLSDGHPHRSGVAVLAPGWDADRALRIAAALERDSRHPLAKAFADVDDVPAATEARLLPGQGIEGVVDGRRWRLGQAAFAGGDGDDGALWLGDGREAVACFHVRETPRADAARAIRDIRDAGVAVEICSGDAAPAVRRLADGLGVDIVLARQGPEQKLAHVRARQAAGECVAMVGDGLNDAPVLAGADVSIAIADGASLAQRAADFVVTSPSLLRIPQAMALARRTRSIVRQNLAWALGYNLLALPLAACGVVTPWIAAIGMALSSLLVTLNALRLARRTEPREHAPVPSLSATRASPR